MDYRIGVIGCGGQGKAHAREWELLDNCRVTAVADPSDEARACMAEHFPAAKQYHTYQELIAAGDVDIVSLATWPDLHAVPTLMAAEHGLHVFCEKPMALDLQECDAMLAACERNGVKLVISHNRRNDPRFFKVKELLAAGFLGRLCRVHAADKGYAAGYGLMNIGTHLFDALRLVLGDVTRVYGHLTVGGRDVTPDDIVREGPRGTGWVAGEQATVLLQFASGVEAVVEWDPCNRFGFEFIGTAGRLRTLPAAHDFWHFPHATLSADNQGAWQRLELRPEENPWDYPTFSTRHQMFLDMLAWIAGGPRSNSCGLQGRAAIEIISAVYWSHMRGGWVDLPLTDTRHPLRVWAGEA